MSEIGATQRTVYRVCVCVCYLGNSNATYKCSLEFVLVGHSFSSCSLSFPSHLVTPCFTSCSFSSCSPSFSWHLATPRNTQTMCRMRCWMRPLRLSCLRRMLRPAIVRLSAKHAKIAAAGKRVHRKGEYKAKRER